MGYSVIINNECQELQSFLGENKLEVFYYIEHTMYGPFYRIINKEELIKLDYDFLLHARNHQDHTITLQNGFKLLK